MSVYHELEARNNVKVINGCHLLVQLLDVHVRGAAWHPLRGGHKAHRCRMANLELLLPRITEAFSYPEAQRCII